MEEEEEEEEEGQEGEEEEQFISWFHIGDLFFSQLILTLRESFWQVSPINFNQDFTAPFSLTWRCWRISQKNPGRILDLVDNR